MESSKKTALSSIGAVVLLVLASSLGRAFLEFFSNPEQGGIISPWYVTLEYFLFFLAVTVSIGMVVGAVTRESMLRSTVRAARFSPIIMLAPVLDLVFSGGSGACMAYLGSSGTPLAADFLTYFGKSVRCGITAGIRIELLIVFASIGLLVWKKTHSARRAALGLALGYAAVFAQLAIPGILGSIAGIAGHSAPWILKSVNESLLATNPTSASYPMFGFVTLMSQIHFLTIVAFSLTIWFFEKRNSFAAWMRNARPERIAYYLMLMLLGAVAASRLSPHSVSWVDMVGFACAAVVLTANWWAAVAINDLSDDVTDAASNPNRPLHAGTMDRESFRTLAAVFLGTAITGSIIVGYPFLFFMAVFQTMYAAYSIRETRWKNHFLKSSAVLGSVGISAILAGFFLFAPNYPVASLPLGTIVAAFVGLAVISNSKDYKDRKGDEADGVRTLPVAIGTKRAYLVVTVLMIAWSIATALVYRQHYFYFVAAAFAAMYGLARKVRIRDPWSFIFVFGIMAGIIAFVL